MKPTIPITDKRFVYRDHAHTDVRVTWAKERERLAALKPEAAKVEKVVTPLRRGK